MNMSINEPLKHEKIITFFSSDLIYSSKMYVLCLKTFGIIYVCLLEKYVGLINLVYF